MSVLKVAYNRPSMLDDIVLSDAAECQALKLHAQVFDNRDLLVDSPPDASCVFEHSCRDLISKVQGAVQGNFTIKETWLLFVPGMVNHQWCDNCTADFIPQLRDAALDAADNLINTTHKQLILESRLLPLWFTAMRVLNSGCVLTMMLQQGWTTYQHQLNTFVKCTEVLTFCAQKWKQGYVYCSIWRDLCAALHGLEADSV